MKKLFVALFLALSFCMPSFAASWYWIGHNKAGEQFYIDNSSVTKDSQKAVIWEKVISSDGSFNIKQMAFLRQKSFAILTVYVYDSNGNLVNRIMNYSNYHWIDIVPGSMGDALYYAIWPY